MPKKILSGVVVRKSSDKTISVMTEREVLHRIYGKKVKRTKKYAVHDEYNAYGAGDRVFIMESRPISKTKRWVVMDKIENKNV
jgi:small subunit ribosomal protein S17